MPKVRIYSPFFPYPVTEGSYQVVFEQVRTLADAHFDVELVCWKDSPADVRRKLAAPSPLRIRHDLRLTLFTPRGLLRSTVGEWQRIEHDSKRNPDSSETVLQRGYRVGRSLLSHWTSPELFHYPPAADMRDGLPPADVGIYNYSFSYVWLKQRDRRREGTTAVHFHNLESDLARTRRTGRESAKGAAANLIHALNARKLRSHELRLRDLVDELWFVSAQDLANYAAESSANGLRVVPPTFDPRLAALRRDRFHKCAGSTSEPITLGFVGRCGFEPNRASLAWIVDHLAPELRQGGFRGRILVAGPGVPEELKERAQRYGFFEWLGFVPDLEEFWSRLTFLLVPHVHGSGVRTKLLEALASGIPVLANRAAAESLSARLQAHPLLWLAERPAEWAERIGRETEPYLTRTARDRDSLESCGIDGATAYRFLIDRFHGAASNPQTTKLESATHANPMEF